MTHKRIFLKACMNIFKMSVLLKATIRMSLVQVFCNSNQSVRRAPSLKKSILGTYVTANKLTVCFKLVYISPLHSQTVRQINNKFTDKNDKYNKR